MGGITPLSFINSLPIAGLGKDLGFYLTYRRCCDTDSQKDEVSINQSVNPQSQIEKWKISTCTSRKLRKAIEADNVVLRKRSH
jgi:hypothetical protein